MIIFVCQQTAENNAKSSLEDEKNQMEQRFTMQLGALNQNLSTLRTELAHSDGRTQELEQVEKDVRGELAGRVNKI